MGHTSIELPHYTTVHYYLRIWGKKPNKKNSEHVAKETVLKN